MAVSLYRNIFIIIIIYVCENTTNSTSFEPRNFEQFNEIGIMAKVFVAFSMYLLSISTVYACVCACIWFVFELIACICIVYYFILFYFLFFSTVPLPVCITISKECCIYSILTDFDWNVVVSFHIYYVFVYLKIDSSLCDDTTTWGYILCIIHTYRNICVILHTVTVCCRCRMCYC